MRIALIKVFKSLSSCASGYQRYQFKSLVHTHSKSACVGACRPKSRFDKMLRLIVDCDAGSDDALALMMLLALESDNDNSVAYKVAAVTCTYGNTDIDNVCQNVLRILEAMHRPDVPVFKGAAGPLLGRDTRNCMFHGKDGFGDRNFADPAGAIQDEDAISAINRLASEDGAELAVMCLGPLTNLALALRVHPSLKEKISQLWIMGGNIEAVGNVDGTSAEFNFYQDPEAAEIVLRTISCQIFILPWEPCTGIPIQMSWRINVMGAIAESKHLTLINEVDQALYDPRAIWNPCDAFLAGCFINNKLFTSSAVHMLVETNGIYTRGQSVLLKNRNPNVTVIETLNFEEMKVLFMKTAKHQPS